MRTEEKSSAVSYETQHSAAIVTIKVPKTASFKKIVIDGTPVEYLHWTRNLPRTDSPLGGLVNMNLHTSDTSLVDTSIRARVEIKLKTTETGRQFIYIDLHPVEKTELPTHKLVIIDETFEQFDHWLVWPAPNMRGCVALIGPEEKLVQLPPVGKPAHAVVPSSRFRRDHGKPTEVGAAAE